MIIDHLVPPMARADTYGDMAKLEQLLDEYATVAALDPDKLPALRAQIWRWVQAERLLEAASRGLWESPDAKTLDQLRQVYLDIEGDLEAGADGPS